LSRDFLLLVLMSSLVAAPLAYYLLNRWLQTFPYHMSIAWWMIAIAVGAGLLITLVTVSFQTFKAAISNPVKSLRTE
jgi:ABC-type antimicrobial peptide transport system permease subunit